MSTMYPTPHMCRPGVSVPGDRQAPGLDGPGSGSPVSRTRMTPPPSTPMVVLIIPTYSTRRTCAETCGIRAACTGGSAAGVRRRVTPAAHAYSIAAQCIGDRVHATLQPYAIHSHLRFCALLALPPPLPLLPPLLFGPVGRIPWIPGGLCACAARAGTWQHLAAVEAAGQVGRS